MQARSLLPLNQTWTIFCEDLLFFSSSSLHWILHFHPGTKVCSVSRLGFPKQQEEEEDEGKGAKRFLKSISCVRVLGNGYVKSFGDGEWFRLSCSHLLLLPPAELPHTHSLTHSARPQVWTLACLLIFSSSSSSFFGRSKQPSRVYIIVQTHAGRVCVYTPPPYPPPPPSSFPFVII